jgi:hypothetical protein
MQRLEGIGGGGILDAKMTLLHGLTCVLGDGTFHVQTTHDVHVSLVICSRGLGKWG